MVYVKFLKAILLLQILGIVGAQDDGSGATFTEGQLSCYVAERFTDEVPRLCANHEQACHTKITQNQHNLYIEKTCKEIAVCNKQVDNNKRQCYSATAIINQVRVCHFCCASNMCNDLQRIPAPSFPQKAALYQEDGTRIFLDEDSLVRGDDEPMKDQDEPVMNRDKPVIDENEPAINDDEVFEDWGESETNENEPFMDQGIRGSNSDKPVIGEDETVINLDESVMDYDGFTGDVNPISKLEQLLKERRTSE